MKKKVLFIHSGGPLFFKKKEIIFSDGGIAHIYNISQKLKRKYNITIFCPKHPENKVKNIKNVNNIKFIIKGHSYWVQGMIVANHSFYKELIIHILKNKYDVILGNSSLISILLPALPTKTTKIGIIHDIYSVNDPRKNERKFIKRYLKKTVNKVEQSGLKISTYFGTNGFSAISPLVFKELVKKRFKKEKIVITGNGVDVLKYAFCDKKIKNSFIYIGRLAKNKKVNELLLVMNLLKKKGLDFKITIIGEGPEKKKLLNIVKINGLSENVVFTGYISEKEKIKLLKKSMFYLSLSSQEGFGIPLLEALSCGTIPIVRDIYAHKYILKNKIFLVKNYRGMAKRIIKLLNDFETRSALATQGRKYVVDNWTWSIIAKRYDKLINLAIFNNNNKLSLLKKSKNFINDNTFKKIPLKYKIRFINILIVLVSYFQKVMPH